MFFHAETINVALKVSTQRYLKSCHELLFDVIKHKACTKILDKLMA